VISIVDDDMWVRDATADYMRSRGYSVSSFASAEDFLQSEDVDRVSCLVLDIQLPGLSGIELQLQLRAAGHTTPVIFITALRDEHVQKRALATGAVALLRKPFDGAALDRCLDKALAERADADAHHAPS
jgi:FixJ family two-component response regulator